MDCVHETNNYRCFLLINSYVVVNYLLYHFMTAAMVDVGSTIDSKLCDLANTIHMFVEENFHELQSKDKIHENFLAIWYTVQLSTCTGTQ